MKIQITARPTFEIPISLWEVEQLIKLSKNHYDSACKAISIPGGFLYGWRNRVGGSVAWGTVDATWHELDFLLKVCENMDYLTEDAQAAIRKLCAAIRGAMKCAENQLSHWSYSYEAK